MEQKRRKVARLDPHRRDKSNKNQAEFKKKDKDKLTAGVPLSKVVPRELIEAPDLVMVHSARSIAAESFRRLRSRLANEDRSPNQAIVITSAAPSEGKSFVSMNLALAFAHSEEGRTLIIDADLRRPALGRWLRPAPSLGLSEVLQGKTSFEHVSFQIKEHDLDVMPAGTSTPDAVELLSSSKMADLIHELRSEYERIIIDSPPVVPFADADVVGRLCDGAVLVARSDQTSKQMFKQAVQAITTTRLLGIVLNDTTINLLNRSRYQERYYYHQYYGRD